VPNGDKKRKDATKRMRKSPHRQTAPAQATEERVVAALRAMREGAPISRAARENHVTVRTIRRYAGDALMQDRPGGRIRALGDDPVPRYLLIPGMHGPREVEAKGLKTARQFARYQAAVNRFLGGDRNALADWHGKKIAGIELITAGNALKSLAQRGLLPHSFYRAFTGGAR